MKKTPSPLRNESGSMMMSVGVALAGLLAAGLLMGDKTGEALKQVADLEFKSQVEQYRSLTKNQVLGRADSCHCLVKGIQINKSQLTETLVAGKSPVKKLGVQGSDCSEPPQPFLMSEYNRYGVKINDIVLGNVKFQGGRYEGNLQVFVETRKQISGQRTRMFSIPLLLSTANASNPSKLDVVGCSVLRDPSEGPPAEIFKRPPQNSPNLSIPLSSGSGELKFADVPPTAKGIFIQYTIGALTNKRDDRVCMISGSDTSMTLGMESKGDGGQRLVAGSAYVPLDGCGVPMRYSCKNSGLKGEFKLIAYIDDGQPANCSGNQFGCPAGQFADGMGGCVTEAFEADVCDPGLVWSENEDGCTPGACEPPYKKIFGFCINVGAVTDAVKARKKAQDEAKEAGKNNGNGQNNVDGGDSRSNPRNGWGGDKDTHIQ